MWWRDLLSVVACSSMLVDAYFPLSYVRMSSYVTGLTYFVADLAFSPLSSDSLLHHTVSLSLVAVHHYVHPFTSEQIHTVFRTEWSTLFLTALLYVKPYAWLQVGFFVSFMKYRLYDFYALLQMSLDETPALNYGLLLVLYSINLYWSLQIVKHICEPLKGRTLHALKHHLCSFTMLWNCTLIHHLAYPKLFFIRLISGLLSVSSYLYHQEVALYYDGVLTPNSFWFYLDITVFHTYQAAYMLLAGYDWQFALLHGLNVAYLCAARPKNFALASFASFVVDAVYLLYAAFSIELFTICALVAIIHIVKPLYDLSFVGTHFLLIWYMNSRVQHLLAFN